jgi:small subunit ribosomal protein S16
MVRIRLRRVGKVKQPSFRVVVADSRSPRDGRIIESIGHYNPRTDPSVVEIDTDRAVHWLQQGAQPSDSVRKLLQITGAWEVFTGEKPAVAATPTPAASVRATRAASTTEETSESTDDTPAEASGSEED